MRLGFIALGTPDRQRAIDFYTDIWGLELVADDRGLAYLRANDGGHHALRLRGTAARELDQVGFACSDQDELDAKVAAVRAAGGDVVGDHEEMPEPGIARRQIVRDPAGTEIAFYLECDRFDDRHEVGEVRPERLGHVVMTTDDLDAAVAFYVDVLGFEVSDWLWPFAAFLRCDEVHHSIALFAGDRRGLQHVAWEVASFDQVMTGIGHLDRHGFKVLWGPGRHSVGENIFTYYKDPDGNVIEYFAEVELFPPTNAREPRRYEMGEYGDDAWRLAGAAPMEVRT